jgi:uncharacterized protein
MVNVEYSEITFIILKNMHHKKNALIWQFQKEGSDNYNYLIGTMHVHDERAFQFEEMFKMAILKCSQFATELNLDEAENMDMVSVTTYPNGTTLNKLIANKLYKKIDAVLTKQTGVGLAQFEIYHPIMVTNFLTESLLSKDRWQSLDTMLWHFAKENGKILRGVETTDEQMDVLKKMSVEEQLKGLREMVSHFSKFRKQIQRMARLYEQANIQKLYKEAKKSTRGNRQLLLYKRNIIMAERLSDMADQGTICAAIGAGHLAGGKGVLRLLKKKGYIVKPA